MWAEALAGKLRAAGTDLAVLEAERIAALWKAEAPLKALQERTEQLQARAAAVEKQVRLELQCILDSSRCDSDLSRFEAFAHKVTMPE